MAKRLLHLSALSASAALPFVGALYVLLGSGAASGQVLPIANVNGTIFDTDGTRLLYAPTSNPTSLQITNVATGANIAILANSAAPNYAYLPPLGTIYTANKTIYNYNGSLSVVAAGSGPLSVSGRYIATINYGIIDTVSGARAPFSDCPDGIGCRFSNWRGVSMSAQGRMAAWTGPTHGHESFLYVFDGTKYSYLGEQPDDLGKRLISSALIDGSQIVYATWDWANPIPGSTSLVLADGATKQTLYVKSDSGPFKAGDDYQLANGWIVYRDVSGNVVRLSPSGTSATLDAADRIVKLSSDGDFAFIRNGTLYLHELSGDTMEIGATYGGAVKTGSQWYFYGNGQLSIVQPTSSGQIYGDMIILLLDGAHALNTIVVNHFEDCSAADTCPRATVWGRGFGGTGSIDAKRNQVNSFSTHEAGFIGGADYRFESGQKLGVALSYSRSTLGVSGGRDKASTDSVWIGLTAERPLLGGLFSADGFYMSYAATSRRNLGTDGIALAHPDGHAAGGAAQFSYPLPDGDFTPFVRLSFVQVSRSLASETGAALYNNFVASPQTYTSLRGHIGMKFRHSYRTEYGLALVPEAQAGVEQELASPHRDTKLWLADVALQQKFSAPFADPGRTFFAGGAGLAVQLDDGVAFTIRGDGRANDHQREVEVSLAARINF